MLVHNSSNSSPPTDLYERVCPHPKDTTSTDKRQKEKGQIAVILTISTYSNELTIAKRKEVSKEASTSTKENWTERNFGCSQEKSYTIHKVTVYGKLHQEV
jgi:hypothetical protein